MTLEIAGIDFDTAWEDRGNLDFPAVERPPEVQAFIDLQMDESEARAKSRDSHNLVVGVADDGELAIECLWCGTDLSSGQDSINLLDLQEIAENHWTALGI